MPAETATFQGSESAAIWAGVRVAAFHWAPWIQPWMPRAAVTATVPSTQSQKWVRMSEAEGQSRRARRGSA